MKTRLRKKFAKKLVDEWLDEVPRASGDKLIIFDEYETRATGDDPRPPALSEEFSKFDHFGYKVLHVSDVPPVVGRISTPGDFQKAKEEKKRQRHIRQHQQTQRKIAEYKQRYG